MPLCLRGVIAAFLFCFLISFSEITVTLFMTGPAPYVRAIHPYGPIVRVDGSVEVITAAFDQPLPRAFSSTYRWRLSRLDQGQRRLEAGRIGWAGPR